MGPFNIKRDLVVPGGGTTVSELCVVDSSGRTQLLKIAGGDVWQSVKLGERFGLVCNLSRSESVGNDDRFAGPVVAGVECRLHIVSGVDFARLITARR